MRTGGDRRKHQTFTGKLCQTPSITNGGHRRPPATLPAAGVLLIPVAASAVWRAAPESFSASRFRELGARVREAPGSRVFVDSRPSSFGRMLRTFVAEGGNINPFLVEELTGVGHDVGGGEHLPFGTLTADGDAI